MTNTQQPLNAMFKSFDINKLGRDFVVGDIHGCFDLLEQQLKEIQFDESKDRLFSVGDLVDRGDKSEDSLLWLDKPWFYAVRGNHEQMAIDYLDNNETDIYILNGGAWFIGSTKAEQLEYVAAFKCLPIGMEVQTKNGKIGIVHADCPSPYTWQQFKENASSLLFPAIWNRERMRYNIVEEIPDIDLVIVGHTAVNNPTKIGNVLFIDTGAVFKGGKLTVLELEGLL